ncbi:hypothetical protein CUMW_149800 [Citrus unshiu]|nr:hypothetical protein CUMW_149800 [Citrus unshiu]
MHLRLNVRLFDRTHYLKVFGIGDVWIAVGWSSDVLPAVERMSNVAVVVPKSGASLWADLWDVLRWLKLLRLYEKRKMSVCLNKVVANLAENRMITGKNPIKNWILETLQ